MKTTEEYKQEIIDAAKIGVDELVKVLKEPIISGDKEGEASTDISADRLKNAVMAKKLAMMDALEMIARIDTEQTALKEPNTQQAGHGFAESRSK